jgi:hypothetical protein
VGAAQAREPQTGVFRLWSKIHEIAEVYEREVRDLPWSESHTSAVIELYRVRCTECGIKAEKVPLLPSKAPFSKRFEDGVTPCS